MPAQGLDKRVQYRRKKTYRTRSNNVKVTKTPGGKLVVQYTGKSSKGATNPKYLGGAPLNGIKRLGSQKRHNAIKFAKTVNRPYGGVLSHDIVREKIVRAFLIEEQKIVKKVMKVKKAPKPAAK